MMIAEVCAGGNLALDFLDGEIDGELVLRIGRGMPCLACVSDQQREPWAPQKHKRPGTLGRREADPGCRANVNRRELDEWCKPACTVSTVQRSDGPVLSTVAS
jgi:hypothetical protein